MDTENLDREAYREWWEAEGRDDESVCPCGAPAEDLVLERDLVADEVRFPAGPGFCPRHRFDRNGASREYFAAGIMDGTFIESDVTPDESREASLHGSGFLGNRLN